MSEEYKLIQRLRSQTGTMAMEYDAYYKLVEQVCKIAEDGLLARERLATLLCDEQKGESK